MDSVIPSRERNGRLLPPPPLQRDVTYVLDTSALRSLSGNLIRRGRASGLDLAISPYTLREVFCHLGDEGAGSFDFRQRNQILKAAHVRLLPEPHSEVVAVFEPDLDTRRETDEHLRLALELLQLSVLPDELAEVQGEVRAVLLEGAKRTRELHGTLERDFIGLIHWVAKRLEQYMPVERFREIPDEVLFAATLGPVCRESWESAGRSRESPEREGVTWLTRSYFSTSYILARARDYAIKARKTEPRLPIDPHDMEDAGICAHLSLVDKRLLVTGDRGTVAAISEAHSRLRRTLAGSDSAKSPGNLWLGPRVMSTNQFADQLKRI